MDTIKLRQEIVSEEGFRTSAYKDSLGYLTIGVGRLIDARKGGGITYAEAMFLLDNDIQEITNEFDVRAPWIRNLSELRRRTLINMAFQLGVTGVLNFKNMVACLKSGDYEGAAKHALESAWAKQTPERAKRMAARLRLG